MQAISTRERERLTEGEKSNSREINEEIVDGRMKVQGQKRHGNQAWWS
jgi:hypothetical protein